jgi:hypothetical protein
MDEKEKKELDETVKALAEMLMVSEKSVRMQLEQAMSPGPLKAGELLVHVSKTTTQEDWDSLDKNSWGGNCANEDCGHYTVGQLPDKNATEEEAQKVFKCEKCGGDINGMESPAFASTLAMRDPAYWDF